MKVSIPNKPAVFQPIEINLVIESQEELDSLIARLSPSSYEINDLLMEKTHIKERSVPNKLDLLLQKLELLKG